MSRGGRRWPPADEAYLIAHYSRRALPGIAKDLGRQYPAVAKHAQSLVARGLLDVQDRFRGRPWTKADLDFAFRKRRCEGWTSEQVASFLGRGRGAIVQALHRSGRGQGRGGQWYIGTYTAKDIGAFMGVSHQWAVKPWIEEGHLKANRDPSRGRGSHWRIYGEDFVRFLEQHPGDYDYDRIPTSLNGKPNPWRQHARRAVDPTAGKLTLKATAALLGIRAANVARRCRSGMLPAVKIRGVPGVSAREWWIEKEAVMALAGRKRAA